MYAKYQRNATSNFNTLGILWHCLVNFRSYLNSFLGKLSTVCAGSANVLPVSSLIILPGPVVTKFTNPSTLILNRNVHKGANWGWVLAFGKFVTTVFVTDIAVCDTWCARLIVAIAVSDNIIDEEWPRPNCMLSRALIFYWWCTWSEICGVVAL